MTRKELNKLLNDYAHGVYWHSEETGNYGGQNPEIHEEIEQQIWDAINKDITRRGKIT